MKTPHVDSHKNLTSLEVSLVDECPLGDQWTLVNLLPPLPIDRRDSPHFHRPHLLIPGLFPLKLFPQWLVKFGQLCLWHAPS